jgi:hypothetical protein
MYRHNSHNLLIQVLSLLWLHTLFNLQVQVIGTPIQLSSLQGIQGIQGIQGLVKMEQTETTSGGANGTLTITPVSGGHTVMH